MVHRRRYANLRAFFAKSGISQAELSAWVGVSPSYMSLIVSGSRVPSLRIAAKIADKANVPIESILNLSLRRFANAS